MARLAWPGPAAYARHNVLVFLAPIVDNSLENNFTLSPSLPEVICQRCYFEILIVAYRWVKRVRASRVGVRCCMLCELPLMLCYGGTRTSNALGHDGEAIETIWILRSCFPPAYSCSTNCSRACRRTDPIHFSKSSRLRTVVDRIYQLD